MRTPSDSLVGIGGMSLINNEETTRTRQGFLLQGGEIYVADGI